ncbi:MAG: PAS domain-containing sensor histidine kinase [Methylophilales bacterium RIFCSPHIGHO2_02_FULL_57_10]|nr:MAG: PAS domain-containing sensor histidine kinase [Methylophilales bacterium RIFCSPHIGHO2_02_FULL_57_10]
MKYVAFIGIASGAVLLYLLSHASANTAVSGQNYAILLAFNIVLAGALSILVGWQLWRLYRQIQSKVMGSRLTLRLLGMFAMMAIIPGLLVYAVSVNFLTRSIESWFNVKVEAALEGGLRLGQSTLDIMLLDLEEKGESMAASLALQGVSSQTSALNDLREKSGVQEAVLLTPQGRIITFSSSDPGSFLPELPSVSQLRQARQRAHGVIDPISGKGLYLRVLVPVNTLDLRGESRILQLMRPVPKTLSDTAESVQSVYQDYQELSYARQALKEVFALTLTLVLLLSMLSAVAFAFVLSRRLSAPLGVLAEGTRAIASGDYGKTLPAHGKDELGILVQSFNSMTQQLREATQATESHRAQVEAARGYLAAILSHLSSGVLALDEHFGLRACNPAAAQILGIDLEDVLGQPLVGLSEAHPGLKPFVQAVLARFQEQETAEWQQQLELAGRHGAQILLVRGTRLPAGSDSGFVTVFDDITQLIQAQRDAAWGEVARRLAHEIKNPLTPIQLSAERLERKLAAKLDAPDAEVLRRATHTIVNQVTAMKSMVNEFSEYARSPTINLTELDINMLMREVLALYELPTIQLAVDLAEGAAHVRGDATMLRQVLHNLLQNAQDALEGRPDPTIHVSSRLENGMIRLAVCDNGSGFPEELIARAFEPYVTTKSHGTGLGLAIVKKIVEEHKGNLNIENRIEGGACVFITLPVLEKAS